MSKTMKQLVKSLDFECEDDYYHYIQTSRDNGQYKQAVQLFADLPSINKAECLMTLHDTYSSAAAVEIAVAYFDSQSGESE
jgi:hypothetical protein